MGAGAGAVKAVKPESPQNVHLECDPTQTDIAIDAKYTCANKRATELTVPANTFVSENKLVLNKNVKVKISCKGGGVIRVGLTATGPSENENVLQGSVFETEEGFDQDETSRTLYKTDFHFCYGSPGAEIEYECERTETDEWLYLIYVYGVPEVRIELVENDEVDMEEITLCSITKEQTNTDKIIANTAVCRISEPVVNGEVYRCRWNMKLENEVIAGKSPTYGYMCLRLVSKKKNKGKIKEDIIWERKSAVQEYPFSSVIAFCLNIRDKLFSHNLSVNSVGNTTKDHLKDKVKPNSLYVVIEFSSGKIEVTHGTDLSIAQELGSTVVLSGYECDDEDGGNSSILMEISAKTKFKPGRIQFGNRPASFVLEFNERLTDTDLRRIQDDLGCSVKGIQETNTVQVLFNETDN